MQDFLKYKGVYKGDRHIVLNTGGILCKIFQSIRGFFMQDFQSTGGFCARFAKHKGNLLHFTQ